MMVACQTSSVRLFVCTDDNHVVELRFESRAARADAMRTYERHGFKCSTSKPRSKRRH